VRRVISTLFHERKRRSHPEVIMSYSSKREFVTNKTVWQNFNRQRDDQQKEICRPPSGKRIIRMGRRNCKQRVKLYQKKMNDQTINLFFLPESLQTIEKQDFP